MNRQAITNGDIPGMTLHPNHYPGQNLNIAQSPTPQNINESPPTDLPDMPEVTDNGTDELLDIDLTGDGQHHNISDDPPEKNQADPIMRGTTVQSRTWKKSVKQHLPSNLSSTR